MHHEPIDVLDKGTRSNQPRKCPASSQQERWVLLVMNEDLRWSLKWRLKSIPLIGRMKGRENKA